MSNPKEEASSTSYSRRKALTIAGAVAGAAALSSTGQAQQPVAVWKRHPAEVNMFRFRRAFLRACVIQRKAGKLNKKQFARMKRAAYSGLPYVVKGANDQPDSVGTFVYHLRNEIAKIHPDKDVAAGLFFGDEEKPGIFDELFSFFDWQELFNSLTNWLIENWPDVLKVIITLLIFLETAEQAETE